MTSTNRIINAEFDPKTSRMIVMGYTETPKDEYKKKFSDLVINELKSKNARISDDTKSKFSDVKFWYNLRSFRFTNEELDEIIDAVYFYYESCYFNFQRALAKGDRNGYENYINRPGVVLRRFAEWNKDENLLMFRFWSALNSMCGNVFFDYKFIEIINRKVREKNGLKDPNAKPEPEPRIVPKPCCTIM